MKKKITWMATIIYASPAETFIKTVNAPDSEDKTPPELEAWVSATLQEHGTHNVRVMLSKVYYVIEG